jgi:ribosomal protein S18 acetylase RimI-like enzyme
MTGFSIRRFTAQDAGTFRAIRLEALHAAPEAFCATYEEDAAKPAAWYAERAEKDVLYAGWLDGEAEPSGLAGYFTDCGQKSRHKAHIYSMYVAPRARGTGMGQALVQGLCDHATQSGYELIQLGVFDDNLPAIRLYEKCGFLLYGTEPKAIKFQGRDYDERLYWKPLA